MPQKVDAEFVAKSHGPRGRSEAQQGYDADVAEVGSGGILTYDATPDEVDAVEKGVRSAAKYHGLTPRQGADQPGAKKGTVRIQFKLGPRVTRTRKPKEA